VVALVLGWPGAVGRVVAGTAVAALLVGLEGALRAPPGVDVDPAATVLPLLALGLLVAGRLVAPGRPPLGAVLATAAAVPVLVWGVLHAASLVRPIVPGGLPVGVVRLVAVAALAVGVAAAVDRVRRLAPWSAPTEEPSSGRP
jgi:hypothetical protein